MSGASEDLPVREVPGAREIPGGRGGSGGRGPGPGGGTMTVPAKILAGVLAYCAEVYEKPLPSEEALRVWRWALEGAEAEEIRRAFAEHLRRSKFFPRPADILELLRGSEEDRAAGAWEKVREARRLRPNASVRFDDPIVHYALERIGGWHALGSIDPEEMRWVERSFRDWYRRGERARIGWDRVPAVLPGWTERVNRNGGSLWLVPEPVDARTGERLPGGLPGLPPGGGPAGPEGAGRTGMPEAAAGAGAGTVDPGWPGRPEGTAAAGPGRPRSEGAEAAGPGRPRSEGAEGAEGAGRGPWGPGEAGEAEAPSRAGEEEAPREGPRPRPGGGRAGIRIEGGRRR